MLQTCFITNNIYFFTLNIFFKGTTSIAINRMLSKSVGASVLAKKSKIVVSVNLNKTSRKTLPTESNVTKTIKLKMIVKVDGMTCSNNPYINKTIIGNKTKLIPITL